MTHLLAVLRMVSGRAADLLVSSAWEGVVLVMCVAVLLRCMPRLTPGLRSALWTVLLVLLMLLPLFSWGHTAARHEGAVLHGSPVWSYGLAVLWAVLSLRRLAHLAANVLRLRTISSRAVRVQVSDRVTARLRQSSRTVLVCVSADVPRPSVIGFFKPRILLPAGLLETLSEPEVEHVVLHELEHLRRGDDWTNLLQKLSLALFPLHPALLWLDRTMCVERELAVDDRVLRATRARKAYAACLARLAEDSMMRRGLSLALGLLGGPVRSLELTGRVHRILRSPAIEMSLPWRRATVAFSLTVALGLCVLLARIPHFVSFVPDAPDAAAANAAPLNIMVRTASDSVSRVVPVKAVMPQSRPKLTRTLYRKAYRSPRLERVIASQEQPVHGPSRVVLTAWQQSDVLPRLTFTVAEDSHLTYAAVPVRGGWLLIQL